LPCIYKNFFKKYSALRLYARPSAVIVKCIKAKRAYKRN